MDTSENQPAEEKMPEPVITVIVAVYNGERFLAATLESIRQQTFRDWECVLINDGSTDGTLSIAEGHARLDSRFRIVSQENRGLAAARNRGRSEMCDGCRYITFMDSDDLWVPDALESLYSELERFPDAVGAHGLADSIDAEGKPGEEDFTAVGRERVTYHGGSLATAALTEPTTFGVLAWTNRVFPPGVLLVRRCFYEKAGLFDPAFAQTDDWDMNVRLSRYGDLRFVNKVILSYRRHGSNLSARNWVEMEQGLRLMQHKIFFSTENTQTHKSILKKGWRTLQIMHARRKLRLAREKLASRRFAEAGKALAGTYVQFHRYLRGYPTLRGI